MSRDRSILVVDGDKQLRMSLVRALETGGFHVESAICGGEALLMLEASPFDLVFLDLELSGREGLELLRRVKESRPATAVVVITAQAAGDVALEALQLGAADFLRKPFTPEEIRTLARSVLLPPAGRALAAE